MQRGLEQLNEPRRPGVQALMADAGLRRGDVDATAIDNARDAELLKAVSEKSGINIICATGYYAEMEGGSSYWRFRSHLGDAVSELAELFYKEITEGIRGRSGGQSGRASANRRQRWSHRRERSAEPAAAAPSGAT